jgi:hypothetical protein
MMMCPQQPTCGSQGVATQSSVSGVLGDLASILTVLGVIGTLAGLAAKGTIITILGIAAPAAVWIGAVVGALLAFATVFDFYRLRCLSHPDTLRACTAGVVQQLVPAFNSASEDIFPFTAQHDRVDVVVKCIYWPLVQVNAAFVECNSDPDTSPILRGYYHNAAVCAAGLGSTIGAGVGVVGGILLGVVAGAAIGCATIILCLFALLIALIVAAVTVIVAAIIGGDIGRAAAGGSPSPTADDGNTIHSGDYVTTQGGLLTSGDDDGARIYWFADQTTLHGHSTFSSPFDHTDPDANLTMDGCPPRR